MHISSVHVSLDHACQLQIAGQAEQLTLIADDINTMTHIYVAQSTCFVTSRWLVLFHQRYTVRELGVIVMADSTTWQGLTWVGTMNWHWNYFQSKLRWVHQMLAAVQQIRSSSECVIIQHVLIRVVKRILLFTLTPTPSNTPQKTWHLSTQALNKLIKWLDCMYLLSHAKICWPALKIANLPAMIWNISLLPTWLGVAALQIWTLTRGTGLGDEEDPKFVATLAKTLAHLGIVRQTWAWGNEWPVGQHATLLPACCLLLSGEISPHCIHYCRWDMITACYRWFDTWWFALASE